MSTTKIEWAEKSWNPMTGCTPISEGCKNCYAATLAKRLKAMGQAKYFHEFHPTFHPSALSEPARWKKPCLIFVNSMSDLFHKAFFDSEIRGVFDVMERVDRHKYMVLTKRPERMAVFLRRDDASRGAVCHPRNNIALGTTAENQCRLKERLPVLELAPAQYRFLSLEPLLGPICLKAADPAWHTYIDLVIVGGESGPGARPMHLCWAQQLRDEVLGQGVNFMFKQWGAFAPGCQLPDKTTKVNLKSSVWMNCFGDTSESGQGMHEDDGAHRYWRVGKKRAGRLLDGRTHDGSIQWRS